MQRHDAIWDLLCLLVTPRIRRHVLYLNNLAQKQRKQQKQLRHQCIYPPLQLSLLNKTSVYCWYKGCHAAHPKDEICPSAIWSSSKSTLFQRLVQTFDENKIEVWPKRLPWERICKTMDKSKIERILQVDLLLLMYIDISLEINNESEDVHKSKPKDNDRTQWDATANQLKCHEKALLVWRQ